MRPPGGGGKISFSKNREEIDLKTKKEKLKSSLFLDGLAYFFPFFLPFMIVSANLRTRYSKISELRANRDRTQRFWLLFVTGNREEKGWGKNKGFWPLASF